MIKRWIKVKTQFHALHSWPECPIEEVAFLRSSHRHTFHVEVKVEVNHHDRDIEFFVFQRRVEDVIQQLYGNNTPDLGRKSCEEIAEDVYNILSAKYYRNMVISVSEDGEVAAEIEFVIDKATPFAFDTRKEWEDD